MIHEEQCAINALCREWQFVCKQTDRYYANGDIDLAFSAQNRLFGFLEGMRHCALILGYQDLRNLAQTAIELWCYRPGVNVHRTAKEITEAA